MKTSSRSLAWRLLAMALLLAAAMWATATPQRLTREVWRQEQDIERSPWPLPMAEVNTTSGTPSTTASGSLQIPEGDTAPWLDFACEIRTRAYNLLEVRMRVERGTLCKLVWAGSLEPSLDANPGATEPIFADGRMRDYALPLGPDNAPTWAGQVDRLRFYPSALPGPVEIAHMTFKYLPPVSPARAEVAWQSHEALLGAQRPWEILVPSQAVFETHVGLLERAWTGPAAGDAQFLATLGGPGIEEAVLADEVLEPVKREEDRAWRRVSADLSAYAGQRVRISLRVNPLGPSEGDYAYWGNPMVYSRRPAPERPPIVLISCDTLRADHLSCYGYERLTTPYLDAFAQECVLFENAIAEETWTLPSHATMLTGLHPKRHRATVNANLAETVETLAERLRGAGYLTAAVTGSSLWFYPWRGLAQGFDYYNTPKDLRDVFAGLEKAEAWLDDHAGPPFFLFFHNMDMHTRPMVLGYKRPYGPSQPEFLHFSRQLGQEPKLWYERDGKRYSAGHFLLGFNERKADIPPKTHSYLRALYDDAIRMVDVGLHRLIEKLKAMGHYDDAIIVVTADHGEDLGDHGRYGHWSTYEECAHVPLLLKLPHGRFAGTRVTDQVQLADLFPTLCEAAGLSPPEGLDGSSLLPVIAGQRPGRRYTHIQRCGQKAVRTAGRKYIRDADRGREELYALDNDPGEIRNVVTERPVGVKELVAEYERFYSVAKQGWHVAFEDRASGWQGEMNLSTGARVVRAQLHNADRNNRSPAIDRGEGRLSVYWGKAGDDEFVLETVPANARILLRLTGLPPCVVAHGGETAAPARNHLLELDPALGTWSEPTAQKDVAGTSPLFRVWYVPPENTQTEARALDEEQLKMLESLGYLDSGDTEVPQLEPAEPQ